MSLFTHLRTHSNYSLLRGLPAPGELVQAAVKNGMQSLALTDYRLLTGAIEFYTACKEAGVKPILGLELEVLPSPNLAMETAGIMVFLAMDLTGWTNLCRMSSLTSDDHPGLTFEQLSRHTEGLVCLTGGKRGLLESLLAAGQRRAAVEWLSRLQENFPDRLYVELQRHSEADQERFGKITALSRSLKLPVVASHDIHYLHPNQASLQRTVSAIRQIQPVDGLDSSAQAPPEAYFKTPDEMGAIFADFPQALAASEEIASRCSLDLPLGKPRFPELPVPPGSSLLDLLREKAQAGAARLYGAVHPELQSRLDYELGVIGECGFASLFLIMEEILDYARQKGIPFSSRGSAASSLVAHCLGITSPDPIRLNLYFERFLNPARVTPPDIDTDLCSRRRDEVINFVYERFGQDRVATICTINRFRRRSALRETAKAFALPAEEIHALADSLPHFWYGSPGKRTEEGDPFADLRERFNSETHQVVFAQAAALIGLPHHLSLHPGGVVISPGNMTELVPTQVAAKGVITTQWDMDSIEKMGLVKIDLLGIRGLTVIGDVSQIISAEEKAQPVSAPKFLRGLSGLSGSIPEVDPETSDTLEKGRTIGCFQIESPGMRLTLKEVHARTIDDIMVALALYRPGPLTGGLKDSFVRRHLGKEPTQDIHPALSTILADTYGVILYQEQVLRIAHELAGLSLAEADLLRRAMSHFDPGKQMETLKEKFLAGAWLHHTVPEQTASRIWELMAAFAGYGFPKAHAASYAQISWQSAWCKTHLPAFFMTAVLANWGGYYSQRIYLTEARRMGLNLRPPHVNYAQPEFSLSFVDQVPVLFMGLDQVRELTRRTQIKIIRYRPFHSFIDFLARVDPRPVEAENLVKAGALEGFAPIPALLDQLSAGGWQGGQMALFNLENDREEDWTLREKVAAQEIILGVSVIAHPVELAEDAIQKAGALTTVEAAARLGERVRIAGMRQTWRRSQTTRGDYIYFLSLEDLEGMLDVIISSEVYRKYRTELSDHGPYIIEGNVILDPEKAEPFIRAERIWKVR
jgi:DNA polymerase-3 subunit alpha